MNLSSLQCYRAVATMGSVAEAARSLRLSVAAVLAGVRAIEDQYKLQLIEFDGDKAILTSAGQILLPYSERIIATAEEAMVGLSSSTSPDGKFVIGLTHATVGEILPSFAHQFLNRFPNVELEILDGFSGSIVEWLATGRVDVGVLYNAPKASYLFVEPLRDEELFVFGPHDEMEALGPGAISMSQLSALPLIVPSRQSLLSDSDFSHRAGSFSVILEIDTLDLILELVDAKVGYSILPEGAGVDLVRSGRIAHRPIEGSPLVRTLMLATSTQKRITDVTKISVSMLRRQLRGRR